MRVALIRNWWSLVLRGSLGVLLGLFTFAWPEVTLAGLVVLFGVYALIDGIISLAGVGRAVQSHERWGVASLIFGFVLMAAPQVGAIVLAFWFGMYAFVFGVLMIALGLRLRTLRNDPHFGPAITAHAH